MQHETFGSHSGPQFEGSVAVMDKVHGTWYTIPYNHGDTIQEFLNRAVEEMIPWEMDERSGTDGIQMLTDDAPDPEPPVMQLMPVTQEAPPDMANLTFVIQRVPFKHIRLFLLDRHVCICFNFVIFFEVSLPLLGEGFAEHAFSLLQHPVLCGVCVCACACIFDFFYLFSKFFQF